MTDLKNIQQQTKFKILLIGDSCVDQYIIGVVDRLSPEAPVPIIKRVDGYSLPGMAANVLKNLKTLEINPDFVTNKKQIFKTRYIDKKSGQHLLRCDSDDAIDQWDSTTPEPIDAYDAIIISDYNKGFLTYENIEYIIKNSSGLVFIDTKKQDLSRFSSDRVYVKINETEYKNRHSVPKNLIVTLGDRGAMFGTNQFPTRQVEVLDVCGCGDTFLSALAYRFLYTNNIEEAIIFANQAACVTVQHRGNYAPTLTEINNARRRH